MRLTPQQAPLYGRCMITVQLADEELAVDEEGGDYFLLFAGSTQRHLTSTLRSGHDTLQALCPAHDCCEEVSVTLCLASPGDREASEDVKTAPASVAPVAEDRFGFVQDLAFDMAQFLVSTVGRSDGLDGALLLDECHIPLQECERLDESLALALHHIALPPGWSLLGGNTDLDPRETLLHFSARRGLVRVTDFLLRQPGAGEAARLANRQGHTPAAVAAMRGHDGLHQLLARAEAAGESDEGPERAQLVPADARVACHLPRLRTHTLTQSVRPGRDPPTLCRNVEQLLHLTRHLHAKRLSVLELHTDSLHTTAECCEDVDAETSCPHVETSENSSGSCGHGEEEDQSLSVSTQEPCPVPLEDRVCLQSARDYHPAAEGRERPAGAHNLSESAGEGGSLPPGGWGEQETDREEEREATEGEDVSEQEAAEEEDNDREEETPGGGLVMGQSPSADCSEEPQRDDESPSHTSELPDDEEGLAKSSLSAQEDLPLPSGVACDEVTTESDVPFSAVQSLEEDQETAAEDYAAEQDRDPARQSPHGASPTAEEPPGDASMSSHFADETPTGQDSPCARVSPEPAARSEPDPDSGLTHGLSSDDDVSFQSVGSSTTDIFHPTEESASLEEHAETPHDSSTCSPPEEPAGDAHLGSPSEPEEPPSPGGLISEAPEEKGSPVEPSEEGMVEDRNADQNEEGEASVSEHAGTGEAQEGDEPCSSTIHRDAGEASFPQPPPSARHSGSSQASTLPASFGGTASGGNSCSPALHRDSGSDAESLLSAEVGYDSVFIKNGEPVTGGDSTSEVSISCSSTDDTASVGPSSSSPDDGSQGLGSSWSPEEVIPPRGSSVSTDGGGGGGLGGEAEEEAKDRVTEVPRRSSLFRSSLRSLSPLRRHSWGPGKNNGADGAMNQRSYSLEGLSGQEEVRGLMGPGPRIQEPSGVPRHDADDRGSLVSLTEEQEETAMVGSLEKQSRRYRPLRNSCPPMSLPLTKSVSMLAISHRDIDVVGRLRRRRRISFSFSLSPILTKSKSQFLYGDSSTSDDEDSYSMRSFSSTSGSLAYSISEEEPGPLRSDTEGKGVTKVSRTFSYLKNKMYKKTREKERDKKEKETKEKEKKAANGHHFNAVGSGQALACSQCSQCNKALSSKETFQCTYCNACVHKGCREGLPVCAKVKMKVPRQQVSVPDSSSFPGVTMRNKSGGTRERPWSAILTPEDHSSLAMPPSRRHTSLMPFHGNNLSKSLSISNIAGPVFDEMPIKGLRYLSQSTDSLNRTNQVTESMESLTDEGTEMMDGQLMGEFEGDAKELEADSWSLGVEQQYLQQLDRNLVKRQDVIYELMQTEMHHIRTLRIMSEVYSKGLQKEAQLEQQTLERLFPALDELLELHTHHLLRLLERKKESLSEGGGRASERGVVVHRIGDILLSQFSGSNGESMKRIYGRFCSRHNEAVNFYKDLLTKDKRFKAFIKKKMSSSIVRRLGIPECILLVTQRITKYPVLIHRILQHTIAGEEDYEDLAEALRLVKQVIAAVDAKVNEHDKRRRLKDFHGRTDSKSIMMMKSGQIFAREDLLRRRLIHDGALQLKSSQGRLKDVHALLLSDVLVFLQEKDQKYVFAMLDQRSTVISLQKLIVREVANEERGLFLITAGIEKPEMMEVLASSKEERNAWMQLIQDAMQSMERDEDEGIPSETEDDKRQLESKAKEMRDLLRQKDSEIMSLLEEKVRLFRGMWEGSSPAEEACRQAEPFFRSPGGPEPPRGACIMKDALQEVETLQALVNGSLGGAMASVQDGGAGAAGPVCLPRRAETFGGFDSHLMHGGKSVEKDESEDATRDLRRTESDSVLKKGGNANLLLLLKRSSEQQVLHSVSNLHLLLSTLQAVVVQQDSFIEDQRQALSERSSSCSSLTRPSSRPGSLIEQEKQRSLEKQRQELASLHKQQAAHADERRRREKEWEARERRLGEKEALLHVQEEALSKQQKELEDERRELQTRKEDYQRDLERLRDAQRKLDKDREAVQRQLEKMEELRRAERTPSTTSDESQLAGSSQSLELDPLDVSSSSSSQRSKPKVRGLNPFTSSSSNLKGGEPNNQLSKSLLQLTKNRKDGKDKRKKKVKGQAAEHLPEAPLDGEIFFC
uniref:A-kinase anchor protein 13 isoform X3 n=1 Tax=Doryrhamphus excisus TaxID=161450 RepID=UPI0025AE2436|nr:A-kinase anchor protein 13 isoform X3 [Doryrhamphus excisus]